MSAAFLLSVVLIALAPLAVIWDGPILQGTTLIVAAAATAATATSAKPGQFGFALSTISVAGIAAALPALWMVIQLLPLHALGLNNPIWESAAAVLGTGTVGSISIDRGATLVSLTRYVGFLGIALATATIATDRVRAGQLCLALAAAACLIGLAGVAGPLIQRGLALPGQSEAAWDTTLNCAVPGVLICAAAWLQSTGSPAASGRSALWAGWIHFARPVAAAGLLLCLAALLRGGSIALGVVAFAGMAVILLVHGLRRFGSGLPQIAAVTSVLLLAVIAGSALQSEIRTVGPALAFAMRAPPEAIDTTRRMAGDASWAGTGAGTFAYAAPFHRDVHALDADATPPTAAAMIAVEMGEPFLWIIVLAGLAVVLQLLRGAVKRGRDWIYSAVAAACLVAASLQIFTNAAVVNSGFFIILAVVTGVGLAQSRSRSSARES